MNIRGSGGMNIRGAGASLNIRGSARESSGFSIKGASGGGGGGGGLGTNELFPMKAGANAGKELFGSGVAMNNQGKELFSGKLKGRGVTRRTAASYF
jgi:hypothetical protein